MSKDGFGTRNHIIEVAEAMLSERPSRDIHLADIAEGAHVGVQTIYYHFDSRNQLIAEAQAAIYQKLTEPLHEYLILSEAALVDEDQPAFWSALGENVKLAWAYGHAGDRWKIPKLLIDISSDAKTQREFSEKLELQLERWINVIESAKELDWIDSDVDTYALITACWAGSVGQAIFAYSSKNYYTPETIQEFFLGVVSKR
ncbi:MAG TPA: TetR/AcrR family transcriptional regulator [Acidimicrobiales bacterium]|jgi:AcrR family transcriptional regulator|nr:TetR/AcrR family transcriptional regulator [Acidimicrobiales bacterium]